MHNCIKKIATFRKRFDQGEVKDMYIENYKTLMKEIKEDTTNGKIFCAHGLED